MDEHLHHRGSFGHFPANRASALGFSILPEESGWQRWQCSDKCITLPARGTWSSASETAQNLQGPKSPCPITKTPPAYSKKELFTLVFPHAPAPGNEGTPQDSPRSTGAAAAARAPHRGGRHPSPWHGRAGSERLQPWPALVG